MEDFYSLHDFLLCTKNLTYILMGVGVLGLLGYWIFLTERDEDMRKF